MATTTELMSSAYSALEAHAQLMKTVEAGHHRRRALISNLSPSATAGISFPDLPSRPISPESPNAESKEQDVHYERRQRQLRRTDLPPEKMEKVKRYHNYIPEEETIRNDYSQQYVDGGDWPQNWVLGAELEHRFEEYPKQRRLLELKQLAVKSQAHPPAHLPLSSLQSLHPCKFDVILIDPPYSDTSINPPYGGIDWGQIAELPVPALSADPSFVFLWVGHGNSDGLERGREVLAKWGFRRCEDIVWVKTNKTSNRGPGTDPPPIGGIMTRTTEHCLMGIRGTVRRSTDGWFVHCNIDTDVIIWEGDPTDGLRKPPEMYSLIENFCLGTRRLEIFGRASSLRPGWVTVGDIDDAAYELEKVDGRPWDREWYDQDVRRQVELGNGKPVVVTTPEIEQLRPKSPNRPDRTNQASGSSTPSQGRMNNSAPQMQNMVPNQQMQMMHGGMHHMQAGPGPVGIPGFSSPGMVPMMGANFNPGFPQGEGMMMQPNMQPMMGMGNSPMGGMRPSLPANPMQAQPMMGAPMNPMGMTAPIILPQNAPIRFGGGPMQNLQIPNAMGGGMMMPNMMGPMQGMQPGGMGMNMQGGAMLLPSGPMSGMQMGMQPPQMNPMVPGMNGMQFMNNNRNWQPNNPQGGNWNPNQNY
ncbi:N6-adenosine-methyltransferase subunit METTL14 {ECO:0000250/UniProtKB:Q3UIK4}; AltName: Full=Methyltransferase-like protein 14 [Serendipita indica DSM 11827]|uniref:MT-A70-domain-containing protein n=1 Tax=Serendipita indica (strain DSM 11827) TaxID=1109443 RepID=G4TIX9_SERID|nr:N6-adenosine-methyltransferase subunit METTL14 {ECO:0000250/UniProtKB:Q3UIK4}; AltName: Full=Methyltransferase-like protein 14 [Serendipita indica DSM 11827]CCA71286.1 hypothetical protein PIIN_05225 [Serendipita indica DSM 11827]